MSRRNVVIRSKPSTDPRVCAALADAGAATVHEAQGRTGFVGPEIRPIQQGLAIAGPAVTVSCQPGDNMMLHAAVEVCSEGDVLVVTNTGPSMHGMFGDLLATSLMARGVVGLVIDAGVRDTADLRAMGFGVWSRWVSVEGTVKETPGSVNVGVTLGAVRVAPGDIVCADDDGVVVVPHGSAADVLEASRARLDRESEKRGRLAAGELSLDMDGIRERLVDMGVEFLEEPLEESE